MTKKNHLDGELRQSLKLSLPLMASQIAEGGSGFISTIIIAHLGKSALAASGLVMMSWATLMVLIFGALNALSSLVAQQYGANNHKEINKLVAQGFHVAWLLAIPVIILMHFEPYIFKLTEQDPSILSYAIPMLHTLAWSMLPLALLIVMQQFLIGIGRTRLVLAITLLQVPFEILMNYAFVYGKFGLPRLGIAGVGYGFTSVFLGAALIIAGYLSFSKVGKQYPIFKDLLTWHHKHFKNIMRVGWPIGIMYGAEVAFFTTIAFLMGRFGVDALAAHQIAIQYISFVLSAVFGISQAVGARVGHAVGRKDRPGIGRAFIASCIISLVLTIVIGLVYVLMPHYLVMIDAGKLLNARTIHFAVLFLSILAFLQISDGIRLVAVGALRGLNDTRTPLWISIASFWGVGLVLAYILAFWFGLHGPGLWLGTTLGDLFCAIVLVLRFQRHAKSVNLENLV